MDSTPKFRKKSELIPLYDFVSYLSEALSCTEEETTELLEEVFLGAPSSGEGAVTIYDCTGRGLARSMPIDQCLMILHGLRKVSWFPDGTAEKYLEGCRVSRKDATELAMRAVELLRTSLDNESYTLLMGRISEGPDFKPAELIAVRMDRAIIKTPRPMYEAILAHASDSIAGSPAYLDPTHPRFSSKLAAAIYAWEAVSDPLGKSPKSALREWLEENAARFEVLRKPDGSLNKEGIEDCASVANWRYSGGAPKTPGG